MARRKRTSTVEDFIELVSLLPWWVGVALALVSVLFLHAWSAGLSAPGAVPVPMLMLMLVTLINAAQYAVPFFCLMGAVVSAFSAINARLSPPTSPSARPPTC